MTDAQRRAYLLAHDRIDRLEPDMQRAVLAFVRIVASSLSDADLLRVIQSGALEQLVRLVVSDALIERAALPLRQTLRTTMGTAFRWNVSALPKGGRIAGTTAVMFDTLNPRVIAALRSLERDIIEGAGISLRATVRQAIERGITEGVNPRATARYVREVIGLSPTSEGAVANFRRLLETGDLEALRRELRDRRFDRTLERALGKDGTGLSADQIDRMVAAYRKRALAHDAERIAHTATLMAYRIANREAWLSAIDRGIVPGGRAMKKWIHLDAQPHPRLTHTEMGRLPAVPIDQPYQNGDMVAGESDPWNCHCQDYYFIAA
jgi:hypothetical protein